MNDLSRCLSLFKFRVIYLKQLIYYNITLRILHFGFIESTDCVRPLEYLLLLFATFIENADWEYGRTETNRRRVDDTTIFRSLFDCDRLLGIITHRSAVIRLNTNRWGKGKINRPIDEGNRTECKGRELIGRRGMRSELTTRYTRWIKLINLIAN